MAGNYPDAPSWRMAYDRDGTQAFTISNSGTLAQLTAGNLVTLNDESDGGVVISGNTNGTWSLVFIFPELRDVDGVFWATEPGITVDGPTSIFVETSTNTTNGLDGTWSALATHTANARRSVKPVYRTGILSSTALAVRAVKFRATTSAFSTTFQPSAVHLYGEPAPGANPNRLELWHPTLDEKLPPAYFDWGDVPRSSSADRLFRVKNLSATQTAGSTRVAMDVLSDTTPSVPAQHTLSHGGGSFLAQVNIGDLAPGAISGPVTFRRVTPSNAVLSLWTFRVFAESTNWT